MVQAVPAEEAKVAQGGCNDDALTEKLTSVTEAANKILSEKKSFTELKSFANPPKLVQTIIVGLHAFKCDMPIKNVDWLAVKRGPIFKSNFSLNDLDLSNLTAN